MAYRGQNAAEKRDIFEYTAPERPEITALPENKNVKRPVAKKAPVVKYTLMVACVFAMLLCLLAGYSKVTQLTLEADKKRAELAELESQANALNAKKEQRFNLEYVEQVAVQELGMVKQDKSQITYVAISNPEKITIAASDEVQNGTGLVAGLVKSFNVVVEYLN